MDLQRNIRVGEIAMASGSTSKKETIFISYARDDAIIAHRLARGLESAGFRVWYDARLSVGENWADETFRNLHAATAVIVLISPASISSEWVRREWQTALHGSARVLPVRVSWTGIYTEPPIELADIQWYDLGDDFEKDVAALASAIRHFDRSATEPKPAEVVDIQKIIDEVTSRVYERIGVSPDAPARTPSANREIDNLVFVICPFHASMEPVYEAITAAATECELEARRVKDVQGDYRITEKMLEMIQTARFVVADLTLERPNVYFELGYARALQKTVITICRDQTPVHFDVQDWTYLKYVDSRPLERDLIERFRWELQQ